jgi:Ca2+-binding EF-hand superfamily protein
MKIDINRCRQLLGERSKTLSDEEVQKILNALDGFADLLIESFLSTRNSHKNHDNEV